MNIKKATKLAMKNARPIHRISNFDKNRKPDK